MIDFSDQVVFVTGGGAGIGRATAAAFADCEATAAGWYRDDRGKWTNMPVIKGNSALAAE